MRITGGKLGGRKLSTPKGRDIRPTTDKIRLAVFNMLNSRGMVNGAVVLDAFCGTGALGLEAISHGAKSSIFIDKDIKSLNLAKENSDNLGVFNECIFIKKDSTKIHKKPDNIEKASLLFFDPPYKKGLVLPAIDSLKNSGWISEDAFAVIEVEKEADISIECKDIKDISVEKLYGDIKIIIAVI